jgi:hypothetical protein
MLRFSVSVAAAHAAAKTPQDVRANDKNCREGQYENRQENVCMGCLFEAL